jgi:hypothetical protein
MTLVDRLEDILKNGLVADVFRMERAYLLHKAIGERSDTFNSRDFGNFGEFFGTVQQAMEAEAVLAVSRLYDRPHPKYPTRCLWSAIAILEESSEALPEIAEIYHTRQALLHLTDDPGLLHSVQQGRDAFLLLFIPAVRAILESADVRNKVEALKYLRDKHLAHNEAAARGGPTWEMLTDLIECAKGFIGVIGWAFYNTVYIHEGQYVLSEDAGRPSRCLARLAERLHGGT